MLSYISDWQIVLVYYSLLWYQYKDPLTALKVLFLPARIFFQELFSLISFPLSLLPARPQKIQRPRGPRRPLRKIAKLVLPALVAIQLLTISDLPPIADVPTLPAPTECILISSSLIPISVSLTAPMPTPTIYKGPTDVSVYNRPMGMAVYSPRIDFLLPSATPTSFIPIARPTAVATTPAPSPPRPRFLSTLLAIQMVDTLVFNDFRSTRNQRLAVGLGVSIIALSLMYE